MLCFCLFEFDVSNFTLFKALLYSVPPSFRDAGAWERGNAHWGRVETPQNFGVFWGMGRRGGVRVPNIGGLVSKIIKKRKIIKI